MPTKTSPIAELRTYASFFASKCRASRWFGALFHVGVVSDIIDDAVEHSSAIEQAAHSSAVHDEEAIAKLEGALADGLDASDLPAIQEALRLIGRSAQADRNIGELARV